MCVGDDDDDDGFTVTVSPCLMQAAALLPDGG